MAYSYTAFTGNGSTTQYAVSFPYIRREHVAVTVAGLASTFTWVNNSLIQMDAAPANGAAVRVCRTTPIDAPLVDFADGSTLVAADLDANSRQSIYIQQELNDAQVDNLADLIPNGNKGDITTSASGAVWAINGGAVLEAKIATGAVTETKLGTGAVTSAKILDGTIVNADVNASAGITAGKLSFTQAGTGAIARTVDSKLKDVVSVKDFGAAGDGATDDTTAIQAAIDACSGKVLILPSGTYLTSQPLVIPHGMTICGASRTGTTIQKTTTNTYACIATGQSVDAVFAFDAKTASAFVFRAQISDLTLTGSGGVSAVGVYLGRCSQSSFANLLISSVNNGLLAVSSWLCAFRQIRVGSSTNYAFSFGTSDHTSLVFEDCYAEACAGGFNLSAVKYSSLTCCASDYTNTGGKPGNPYGASAKGNYQAAGRSYSISSSDITMNSCGSENSTATYLYCESSNVVLNSCRSFDDKNHFNGDTSYVHLAGSSVSRVCLNSCELSSTNQISSSSSIRGVRIETPASQKLHYTKLPVVSGYGSYAYEGVDGFIPYELVSDSLFDFLRSNQAPTASPFTNWNSTGLETSAAPTFVTNATTGAKSLKFTGATNTSTIINHYWKLPLDLRLFGSGKVLIQLFGTYSTGGFGDPGILISESSSFASVGTALWTQSLSAGVISTSAIVDITTTQALVWLVVNIVYAGSSVNLSRLEIQKM